MKRRWLNYLALGLAAFLLALVATLPARQAYGLVQSRLGNLPLTLHEVGGTVWSGQAGALAYRSTPLGALQWELSPWRLLLGRLALAVQLQDDAGAVSGRITVHSDGSAVLREVTGRLPAGRFMLFNPGLPIAADGIIALNLEEAQLPAEQAPALRGTVVWSQALLVAGQPLRLGDLKLTLQPGEDGGTTGVLADAGGPLEINGTLSLDKGRNYRLEAKLRARPEAEAGLGNALQMLGRPDGRGYYTLRYSGRL